MKYHSMLLPTLLLLSWHDAAADQWNFPLDVNDKNTTISFEVDSTWHLVEGTTTGVDGQLMLSDPHKNDSISGEISLPVTRFDTDNSKRDSRMREVMEAEKFPRVLYSIRSSELHCDNDAADHCTVVVHGQLTIRDVARDWEIKGSISQQNQDFIFRGDGTLDWSDFGIADPSILIAHLDKKVQVHINVRWSKQSN